METDAPEWRYLGKEVQRARDRTFARLEGDLVLQLILKAGFREVFSPLHPFSAKACLLRSIKKYPKPFKIKS